MPRVGGQAGQHHAAIDLAAAHALQHLVDLIEWLHFHMTAQFALRCKLQDRLQIFPGTDA